MASVRRAACRVQHQPALCGGCLAAQPCGTAVNVTLTHRDGTLLPTLHGGAPPVRVNATLWCAFVHAQETYESYIVAMDERLTPMAFLDDLLGQVAAQQRLLGISVRRADASDMPSEPVNPRRVST